MPKAAAAAGGAVQVHEAVPSGELFVADPDPSAAGRSALSYTMFRPCTSIRLITSWPLALGTEGEE